MRSRFYIRIPKIDGIPMHDLQSNPLYVQIADEANGETTKTQERNPDDLNFDNETLCFTPKQLEGVYNFMLKSKTASGENVLANVKIPLQAIPIDKKVKIKVEMTRIMVSAQPWMTVVLHFDTKGKQPFDCSKGRFDRSKAPNIVVGSKKGHGMASHHNSSSEHPDSAGVPDTIPEFTEDIQDDDSSEILPPSYSSQHGGNRDKANFPPNDNPGNHPQFRVPGKVTFANPNQGQGDFPMNLDLNDPSRGLHSNPISQYASLPHGNYGAMPPPVLPTAPTQFPQPLPTGPGGFPPMAGGVPPMGMPMGGGGMGPSFAPMGLPPAQGRSPKAFYSNPAQPRLHNVNYNQVQGMNPPKENAPRFNNPYLKSGAPQMPVGDEDDPLNPQQNSNPNLANQIQQNISRQMAFLDTKNQQTYNLGVGPSGGFQNQPNYNQQLYAQQMAQTQYQQQLAQQYPQQMTGGYGVPLPAQYQSAQALYQPTQYTQQQYGYQSPSLYATQPYPHYPR
ncbi:proline-rich proteoglycan 2 precursor, putative [Trichomonas vaginalis G3]|uniref:Proline-rich proteoglycan 2, putative n=1 Tax=Trichomonas vaginalis (strain ATCC PRA-98 / G3) TaxID=412133 RepID=A2FMP5_TRIV3|nr:profilin binding [Trichomonas vaginalis G3]EAX93802.1 proline-rich proteoglycan 2 precursor, putative [Trichomonas vaginalis G3]KAI5486359.1 profilin binding [Trichomonas vaginalis G3]|eukprot:XP_001306732.1 proline-rich proteoglycan 2 precursor [Trichomonas vaginalis G3]